MIELAVSLMYFSELYVGVMMETRGLDLFKFIGFSISRIIRPLFLKNYFYNRGFLNHPFHRLLLI